MATGTYAVGLGVTEMGWNLGRATEYLYLEAIKAALADANLAKNAIDGFSGAWTAPGGTQLHPGSADWSTLLGVPLTWIGDTYPQGPPGLMEAVSAVRAGSCKVAIVVSGRGSMGSGLAEYTRPRKEFVAPYGAFTAAHFALVAPRYLHELGKSPGRKRATTCGDRRGHSHPRQQESGSSAQWARGNYGRGCAPVAHDCVALPSA